MSEFQNRAVRLITACEGESALADLPKRFSNLLTGIAELHNVVGKPVDNVDLSKLQGQSKGQTRSVDVVIGDLMRELAAIGYLHDIDIMQAGYNGLDSRLQDIKRLLKAAQSDKRGAADQE